MKNKILKLAKSFYSTDTDEPNNWDHIRFVLEQGRVILGRELTDVETAALAFHDSSVCVCGGDKTDHAKKSGALASGFLVEFFGREEAKHIGWAIAQHDNKDVVESDDLADLIKSADFTPPYLPAIVKKSFKKNLSKGLTRVEAARAACDYVTKAYGSKSGRIFPRQYRLHYENEIKRVEAQADNLTIEKVLEICK